ncbi:MAG: PAS domain-containing protein, partial [Candidatus Thiodiazotropha sp. 4PDIVS1]
WDSASGDCLWEDDMFTLTGLEKGKFEPTLERFLALVHEQDRVLVEPLFNKATSGANKIRYRLVLPDGREMHLLQYSHLEEVVDEKEPKRVSICWRIDNYTGVQKQQHLSVVPEPTPIQDENAGD